MGEYIGAQFNDVIYRDSSLGQRLARLKELCTLLGGRITGMRHCTCHAPVSLSSTTTIDDVREDFGEDFARNYRSFMDHSYPLANRLGDTSPDTLRLLSSAPGAYSISNWVQESRAACVDSVLARLQEELASPNLDKLSPSKMRVLFMVLLGTILGASYSRSLNYTSQVVLDIDSRIVHLTQTFAPYILYLGRLIDAFDENMHYTTALTAVQQLSLQGDKFFFCCTRSQTEGPLNCILR